jgi:tetratricopeptide (TPR) repeat protein
MKRTAWLVALITFAVYLPSARYGFVGFDDGEYVFANPVVTQGFTGAGIRWAFLQTNAANYHPLTWLSLMADVELFGVNPQALHLHNAALHALAAGLFCLLLTRLLAGVGGRETGVGALAAALAALFWSLHPLRVESVTWVTARKDVLSGVFCMLGLLAWLAHVRGRGGSAVGYEGRRLFSRAAGTSGAAVPLVGGRGAFWLVWGCFVLGYGAKPTMMIFPVFLALIEWLDTGQARWRPLAAMAGLAALFLGLTVVAQGEAIETRVATSAVRAGNALISVFVYLRQMVWPTGLCCFYPYNLPFPAWRVALGVSALAGLATAVALCRRRAPYVSLAALWYLAALAPVVGLVQVGSASHADRYTYLATLGFSIALACGGARALVGWSAARRRAAAGLAAAGLTALLAVALRQQTFWRDTVTLLERALSVTQRNAMAYNALAEIYSRTPGKQQLAGEYWRRALAINRNCETLANVALLLLQTEPERRDEAYALAQEALRVVAPGTAERSGSENELGQKRAYLAIGVYHLQRHEWSGAAHYLPLANATGLFTGNPLYWEWIAISYYRTNQFAEALDAIERALKLMPRNERYSAMHDVIQKGMHARDRADKP